MFFFQPQVQLKKPCENLTLVLTLPLALTGPQNPLPDTACFLEHGPSTETNHLLKATLL